VGETERTGRWEAKTRKKWRKAEKAPRHAQNQKEQEKKRSRPRGGGGGGMFPEKEKKKSFLKVRGVIKRPGNRGGSEKNRIVRA